MDDEISLTDLLTTLWRRRRTITIITIVATLIAGAYAFLKPDHYEFKTAIQVGSFPTATEDGRSRRFIESSKNVEDKLRLAYIPIARRQLIETNINTINVPSVTLNKGSASGGLFVLTSQGPSEARPDITELHQRILDLLIEEHNKALSLKIKVILDPLKADAARISDHKLLIQNQIAAIQQRLNQLREEREAAKAEAIQHGNAVVILMVGSEIAETESQLWKLRNALTVDLKSEQEKLTSKLAQYLGNENNLNAHIAELRERRTGIIRKSPGGPKVANAEIQRLTNKIAKAKQENKLGVNQLEETIYRLDYGLADMTPTTTLYLAARQIDPQGPGTSTLLALSFVLSLIVGIFFTLVTETARAPTSETTSS